MKHFRGIQGPHLIIAPKSTLSNWMNEIKRWCPSLKAICLIGSKEERVILCRTFLDKYRMIAKNYNYNESLYLSARLHPQHFP